MHACLYDPRASSQVSADRFQIGPVLFDRHYGTAM